MPTVLYKSVSIDVPKFLHCLRIRKSGYVFGSITIIDGPDAAEEFDWEYLLQLSIRRYDEKTIKIAFCVPPFCGGDRWLRFRLRMKSSVSEKELYLSCTETARLIRECEAEETILLIAKSEMNLKTVRMQEMVVFHFELLIWRQNPQLIDVKPASRKVEVMQQELRNPKFFDKILLIEGRELCVCALPIICHSRSDQLVDALDNNSDSIVAFDGFEYDIMRAFVYYCYTESFPPPVDILELSPANVLKLLLAAEKFLVKGLVDECVKYLMHEDMEGQPFSVLADALWIGIYKGEPKLLEACLARLQWNFEKMANCNDWFVLKQTDKHFYATIMKKLKEAEFEL